MNPTAVKAYAVAASGPAFWTTDRPAELEGSRPGPPSEKPRVTTHPMTAAPPSQGGPAQPSGAPSSLVRTAGGRGPLGAARGGVGRSLGTAGRPAGAGAERLLGDRFGRTLFVAARPRRQGPRRSAGRCRRAGAGTRARRAAHAARRGRPGSPGNPGSRRDGRGPRTWSRPGAVPPGTGDDLDVGMAGGVRREERHVVGSPPGRASVAGCRAVTSGTEPPCLRFPGPGGAAPCCPLSDVSRGSGTVASSRPGSPVSRETPVSCATRMLGPERRCAIRGSSRARPRAQRLLTVPTGTSSISAASATGYPCMSTRISAARCSAGSESRARASSRRSSCRSRETSAPSS